MREFGWLGVLVFGFGSLPFHSILSASAVEEEFVCCFLLLAQSEAKGEDQSVVFCGFGDVGWRCVLC